MQRRRDTAGSVNCRGDKVHISKSWTHNAAAKGFDPSLSSRRESNCLDISPHATVLIFSYGTLQDRAVQLENFGRELAGTSDSLPGYSTSLIEIRDPQVIATSGKTHHTIAERSGDPTEEVSGMVFKVTSEELAAADRYEVEEYTRVEVMLKSGLRAWAYVR